MNDIYSFVERKRYFVSAFVHRSPEVNGHQNCLDTNILQNIFFLFPEERKSCLEPHEGN